jgi:hypothetical protein
MHQPTLSSSGDAEAQFTDNMPKYDENEHERKKKRIFHYMYLAQYTHPYTIFYPYTCILI